MVVNLIEAASVVPFAGGDLRAERARRGLRAADVAWRMGVSRSRISYVEQLARVPSGFVARYCAALDAYDDELERVRSLRDRERGAPRPEPDLAQAAMT